MSKHIISVMDAKDGNAPAVIVTTTNGFLYLRECLSAHTFKFGQDDLHKELLRTFNAALSNFISEERVL